MHAPRMSNRSLGTVALSLALAVLALAGAALSRGADTMMYRGPQGDGIYAERIRTNWTAQQPRRLWVTKLTNGLSSVSIAGGKVFTQVAQPSGGQNTEFCVALNADTGQIAWASPVGRANYPNGGVGDDDGPRSTPAVKDGRVYVLSSYLQLHCFEAETGAAVWSKDLRNQYGGVVLPWQNAASPLLEADLVLVNVNGPQNKIIAVHASDGTRAWIGPLDALTQATPVLATIHGVRHAIFFTQSGLVAVDPATGTELWRFAVAYNTSTAASPVVLGDVVYCSAAYGTGAAAVRVTQSGTTVSASQLWKKRGALQNHWSTAAAALGPDGKPYVYGLYGQSSHYTAPLRCVELETGTERWSEPDFGLGATLMVDGNLLALTEGADLVLVKATPEAYIQIDRYQTRLGRCWNSPALAGGRLYVRATTQLAAYDVSLPPPPPTRLLAPATSPEGTLRLTIASVDGQPIDASRASRIQVLSATDVNQPLAEWTPVAAPSLWEAGRIHIEEPGGAQAPHRAFLVREQP